MQNIIETKNVTRCFKTSGGELWALKGVDIAIPKGALTILKGRSGSGKTTLLNILGALDQPTEGKVLYEGEDITQLDEKKCSALRRTQIGFVFQSVALIPMMSAFENVEYALRLSRYPGDRAARAMECLKLVGLSQRMNHLPAELSGGEVRRMAVARALIRDPDIIFADEPTSDLDAENTAAVFRVLKDAAGSGKAVFVVSHENSISEYADVIYHMEEGRLSGVNP
jgi:putative ABC transport system ATP-binding protein